VSNETKAHCPSTPIGTLSESLEDYLEIILQLQQEKRIARVRDIAARKGVSNASVSNALSRLARDGFVLHEAHEFVELTDRGLELASRVLRRHEFLVAFLRDVLQVSDTAAETDACAIEHQVSAETLERLASFYQFVCSCPKAGGSFLEAFRNCCSTSKGAVASSDFECLQTQGSSEAGRCGLGDAAELTPLSLLKPGHVGIVVRLRAAASMRKSLSDAGLLPNVKVEMVRSLDDGSFELLVQGCKMSMESSEASAVMVRKA
jgi:DtxR family Mn-dependent transcriptional regulator